MKKIGIILRLYFNKDGQEIMQVNQKLIKFLNKYKNITLIYIDPRVNNLNSILKLCDGFIFPGGTSYIKKEKIIYKYALKNDLPLLGICLGFQEICMFNKSKLKTLKNKIHYDNLRKYVHKVNIKKDSILFKILKKNSILVNSIHNDYIVIKPKHIKIAGYSEDGIIEYAEYPNKKCILAMQWHPEYLKDRNSFKIFNYFIKSL